MNDQENQEQKKLFYDIVELYKNDKFITKIK
jgi:hypothetical protein